MSSQKFPDTRKVWKAFEQTMEEADKVFAEADRLFKHSYEKQSGVTVDVTTRRVRFFGRWKTFWYFLKRALDGLRHGHTTVVYRHVQKIKPENN